MVMSMDCCVEGSQTILGGAQWGVAPWGFRGSLGLQVGGISPDTLSCRTQVCSEESPVHEEAPDREAGGDPVGTRSLDGVCPLEMRWY